MASLGVQTRELDHLMASFCLSLTLPRTLTVRCKSDIGPDTKKRRTNSQAKCVHAVEFGAPHTFMTGLGPAKPLGLTFLDADRHPWVHKWVLLLSQKKRRKNACEK